MIMGFSYEFLKVSSENGIWTLVLNRPKALNALNSQVLDEMGDFFRQLSEMDFEHARGLLITGEGEKSFVAGADIKELSILTVEHAEKVALKGQTVLHELNLLKIPVVAAVNGFALGGGCELALACDFILASKNAKFGLPEVSLGLIPGFGGTVRMSRAVGIRKARELIMTGEMISAEEGFRLGLIIKVFETQSELLSEAKKKLELIASRGPIAVAAAKLSINRVYDLDIEAGQKLEAELFANLFETQDVREGTTAFIEGRKPIFTGK